MIPEGGVALSPHKGQVKSTQMSNELLEGGGGLVSLQHVNPIISTIAEMFCEYFVNSFAVHPILFLEDMLTLSGRSKVT